MLDSSSSEEEEGVSGFTNYGNKSTVSNVAACSKVPVQSSVALTTSRVPADNVGGRQRGVQPRSLRTTSNDVSTTYGRQNSVSSHQIDSTDRSHSPHSKQRYTLGSKGQVISSQQGRPSRQWTNETFSRSGYRLVCYSDVSPDSLVGFRTIIAFLLKDVEQHGSESATLT
ncbi:unnamed protein product [Schistosoma mattheei]|uniref:Uncharacterized protein n=1 Tax=Schistosoma mattheei TaxID=31246 RepID=A0AA85B5M2_9TREM|nr:unnamed protein product [Schistosoma mattheei]